MNAKLHNVESIDFENGDLVLRVDGQSHRVPIATISERLSRASEAARRFYRISPSGYGIHWPEADEDLSVDGIIRMATGSPDVSEQQTADVMHAKPNI